MFCEEHHGAGLFFTPSMWGSVSPGKVCPDSFPVPAQASPGDHHFREHQAQGDHSEGPISWVGGGKHSGTESPTFPWEPKGKRGLGLGDK